MSKQDDDRTYRDRVIRLHEFVANDGTLRGLTFVGCYVTGPAVLFLGNDLVLLDNDLGGPDVGSLLWDLTPDRELAVGAVLVECCHFEGCRFERVGFTGPPMVLDQIRLTAC